MRAFGILLAAALPVAAAAAGLSGATRNDFTESTFKACFQNPNMAGSSAAVAGQFCVCYANEMADRISPEEYQAMDAMVRNQQSEAVKTKLAPLVEASNARCWYLRK